MSSIPRNLKMPRAFSLQSMKIYEYPIWDDPHAGSVPVEQERVYVDTAVMHRHKAKLGNERLLLPFVVIVFAAILIYGMIGVFVMHNLLLPG